MKQLLVYLAYNQFAVLTTSCKNDWMTLAVRPLSKLKSSSHSQDITVPYHKRKVTMQ